MTTYPEDEWVCAMCGYSVILSPTIAVRIGSELAMGHLHEFRDDHIDVHCNEFADEMATALP